MKGVPLLYLGFKPSWAWDQSFLLRITTTTCSVQRRKGSIPSLLCCTAREDSPYNNRSNRRSIHVLDSMSDTRSSVFG